MPSEFCVCSSCIQRESILHSFPSLLLSSPSLLPLAARFSSVPRRSCFLWATPSFASCPTAGINSFRYYFARQALTFSIRLIKLFFSFAVPISALALVDASQCAYVRVCMRLRARARIILWQLITTLLMRYRNYKNGLRAHTVRSGKKSDFPDDTHLRAQYDCLKITSPGK